MGALKIAVAALFLALVGPGVQAGAWKCQIDGKTVFSDVPCPTQGKQIDTTSGQTRGVTGLRQDMLREQRRSLEQERQALAAERAAPRAQPPRNCPTATQIKNWETTLSSNYGVSEGEGESAREGLKRARRCAAGLDPATELAAEAQRPKRPLPKVCHPIGGGQVLCPP